MPPDPAHHTTEPAPDHDGQGAGSVVVGLDPSAPAGIAFARVRVDTERMVALTRQLQGTGEALQRMRENLTRTAPAFQRAAREMSEALANVAAPQPMSEYDTGDAMDWAPPPGREETPPCPA